MIFHFDPFFRQLLERGSGQEGHRPYIESHEIQSDDLVCTVKLTNI